MAVLQSKHFNQGGDPIQGDIDVATSFLCVVASDGPSPVHQEAVRSQRQYHPFGVMPSRDRNSRARCLFVAWISFHCDRVNESPDSRSPEIGIESGSKAGFDNGKLVTAVVSEGWRGQRDLHACITLWRRVNLQFISLYVTAFMLCSIHVYLLVSPPDIAMR